MKWNAAADNVGIGRYDIYANGAKLYSTTNLYFIVGNLDSLTQYTFTVKAIDKAGNASPASNQIIGYTHRQGLNYKYYHGSYSNLPNFNTPYAGKNRRDGYRYVRSGDKNTGRQLCIHVDRRDIHSCNCKLYFRNTVG